MKKNYRLLVCIFTVVLIANLPLNLHSQQRYGKEKKVEISAGASYLFGGILPTSNGELNFVNNTGVIGEFTYKITRGAGVNLSYTYVPTELRFKDFSDYGEERSLFDMDIHYFYINYLYESEGRSAVPFAVMGLGGVLADPKDNTYESELRFAANFGGGIKIYPSNSVGLKIQARMLLPVYYASNTVYVSPSGTGYQVGAGSVIQADLSASLTIKF